MARRCARLLAFISVAWLVILSPAVPVAQAPQPSPASKLKNPVASTKASVEQGQAVFQRLCSKCHGDEGKGDGRQAPEGSHPANLTDDHWDHGATDGEIFTTIHDGVAPKFDMDSYEGKITDTDIWNVVNFLRNIGPKGTR
jgi:mono/diheme cytochrome c family protein